MQRFNNKAKHAAARFLALATCVLAAFSSVAGQDSVELSRFEFSAQKMGVPTRVVLYAADEETAQVAAAAVWKRFDELNETLSDYVQTSEIVQVCRKSEESGDFVAISVDLRAALVESRRYCELTDGAFDATVGPIVKLWRRSRYFNELPPPSVLEPAKTKVGLDVWELTNAGVKTKPGVRFDVGGIAKGIALDEALKAVQAQGIESALIDSGGDLRLGAAPPGKDGWSVGVASIGEKSAPAFYRNFANVGIASSGDANRYVEIDGVRYSHIVDPRTGEPLTRRCAATVVAPTATAADALASAVCVIGGEEALKLVKKLAAAQKNAEFSPMEFILMQVDDSPNAEEGEKVATFWTEGMNPEADATESR
ncbi:MAG: FAD:protein FMN transferase [Thermoguttaceae bacterium]|nr:FAD:protein FMN transferase [Thermoguttaceae bacterium]